jgi:hemerythrin superfamily protein
LEVKGMAVKSTRKNATKRSRSVTRTRTKSKAVGSKRAGRSRTEKSGTGKSKRKQSITDTKRDLSRKRTAMPKATSSAKKTENSQRDALTVLRSDHDTVRKLLMDLRTAKSADRQTTLLERIEKEVKLHTHLEEEIFYPAFREHARKNGDRQMYHEALEEHHAVDVILPEVKNAEPGSPQFAGRVKVLKEMIEHHANEEEKEMFPQARKLFSTRELRELGSQIVEEKRSSQAGMIEKVASFLGVS